MIAREAFVHDAGKHMAEELVSVLRRHTLLIRGGGGSPIETSAAILDAANTYNLAPIGLVLLFVEEDDRAPAYVRIVDRLVEHLLASVTKVTATIAETEKRFGGAA